MVGLALWVVAALTTTVNGVPGVAGVSSRDGRATILMPHPERTLRSANFSWAPRDWPEPSPWQRMFRNARVWLG